MVELKYHIQTSSIKIGLKIFIIVKINLTKFLMNVSKHSFTK